MSIYLDKEHRVSRKKATEVAQKILQTTMDDIAKTIYIEPDKAAIVVDLDKNAMQERGLKSEDLETLIPVPNCDVKIGKESITTTPKASGSDLRKLLDKVTSMQVSGVSGIRRVLVTEEKNEWLLKTDGSNLPKVLRVSGVDTKRTVTNDIHEIAETLGIEAARNAIIREAMGVLEEQGLDVDLRHLMLVSDIMTYTGEVHQIGRHGVSGEKSSVLARAAFEITMPTIVDAATKGASDRLSGVTESVIVGQSIPIGTGLIDLYMGGTTSDQRK